MKKSLFIIPAVLVAAAGILFAFALFASPVSAGILDGNFDCLPLPVCPDSPAFDCFPFPYCSTDNDNNYSTYGTGYRGTTVVNCYQYPNRCAQPQTVGRATYATPSPTPNPYTPIEASCYASTGSARVGDSVSWSVNASGGYGSYTYNWVDSDGITGSGQTFNRSYGTPSTRTARVTVHSGSMQITRECGSINIYADTQPPPVNPPANPPANPANNTNTNTNNNTNTNTNTVYINSGSGYVPYQYTDYGSYQYPVYQYPSYQYPTYQYSYPTYVAPISVSCSANTTYATVGNQVVWRAYATGGYGTYTYAWTGTDSLYGYGQTVSKFYSYPGQKSATVTVTSGGQSASAYCPLITVVAPIVYQPPVQPPYQPVPPAYPQQPALDIACYASPTKIKVGGSTTWTADARGGIAPYRFSWSGTDGLVSSQRVVSKSYFSKGIKKAVVTVTSADGRTTTRNCGVSVTVSAVAAVAASTGKEGSYGAQAPVQTAPVQTVPPQYQPPQYYDPVTGQLLPPGVQPFPAYQQPTSTQTATPFFSLSNIPWGWVAFLVILVLFVTVLYLIFNREKI